MIILKEILQNLLMGIPLIKRLAWTRHTTGMNNDPEKANALWNQIESAIKPENKTVLEIGPGRTDALLIMARNAGAEKIHALDVYPYLDKTTLGSIGVDYQLYSGKSMPFEDNSIDFVWSNDSFEHLKHPKITIAELYRVLKPGGMVLLNIDLTDHYFQGKDERLLFNCLKYPIWLWWLMTSNRSAYVNRIRYSEWINLLKKPGFTILKSMVLKNDTIRELYHNKKLSYLAKYDETDATATYASIIVSKQTVS